VSPRDASLALLLTVAALFLLRDSKNPRVPRGNAILIELCLGLVSVGASVFWLKILALAWS
jgi:apolipoprotein N-acyltransferase